MSAAPIRLLFITRHSPLPGEHGSGAYAFDILRFLAASGFAIDCLWLNDAINQKRGWCAVPAEADRVFRLHAPGYHRVGRVLLNPRQLLRHAVKTVLRPVLRRRARKSRSSGAAWNQAADAREKRLAVDFAGRLRPQIVLANYYWLTAVFPTARKATLRAVITHDVFHQRDRDMRAANVGVNCQEISAAAEADHLSKSELIISITEEDAAVFRRLLPAHEVVVAPKAAVIAEAPARRAVVEGRCLFVGGESMPNVDGLEWFLREVWPQIVAAQPRAHLHVCGKVCTKLTQTWPGVVCRGMVEDLAPEYDEAAAVIVPLRAGSGMKIKLVEALAHGRACVSTSVGLQGLGFLTPGRHVWRADEPGDFAAGTLAVLNEAALREQLQENGQQAVREQLAPERAYGPLAARLRELAQRGRATLSGDPASPPPEAHSRVSIVINNYNYGRFLGAAIESALRQTYPNVETLVVDDGSTDDSREVIARYAGRVTPILKANGGQGSALNAGFAASRGEIVIFLDADDFLHPHAVAQIVAGWNPRAAKTHFRLTRIDATEREIGTEPRLGETLPSGDVWPAFIRDGRYVTPATSGSAYARWALDRVMPIPELPYVYAADAYLNNSVVFHGPLTAIQEPLGAYRVHGTNDSLGNVLSADVKRVRYLMAREVQNDAVFHAELRRRGVRGKSAARYGYYQRLKLRALSWKIDREQHPKRRDTVASLAGMAIPAVWGARKLSLKERLLQTMWFLFVLLSPAGAVIWMLSRGGALKHLLKPVPPPAKPAAASRPLNVPSHAG